MQCLILALIHITVAGIELAQPHKFATEALAAYDTKRFAWFFDITTAGAISVVVSCILLWLLSRLWWRGMLWRACLGILLAASLTITIALSARIALVEVPKITPAMAADISMPQPHQMMAAAVLVLLLAIACARRWSEPRQGGSPARCWGWRRDEGRYYHERPVLLVPLALVAMGGSIASSLEVYRQYFGMSYFSWKELLWDRTAWIESPEICLSIALLILAMQIALFRRSKAPNVDRLDPLPLAPGLFLLVWTVLIALIVFGIPILGAWGFALGFNVG